MKEKDLLKKIKNESDRLVPDVYDKVVNAANTQGLLNNCGDAQEYCDGKTVTLGGFKRKAVIPIALALVVAVGLAVALPLALRGNSTEGGSPVIDGDKNAVVYKGMSASANAQAGTTQSNAKAMSAKVSENVSVQAEYSAYRNEEFYISVQFDNPENYTILGLTISYAGTTNLFPCNSFEDAGNNENVYVKVNAKKAAKDDTVTEYTISNITYSDGTEVKSAEYAEGAKTSLNVQINEYGTEIDKSEVQTGTKLNCLGNDMLDNDGVLTVPDGITEIGRYAFAYDESIKEIIIPDTVQTIDEGAFYDCLSVEKVTFGAGIEFIDRNAFHNCENISYVNYTGTLLEWCQIDFCYTEEEQSYNIYHNPEYVNKFEDKEVRYSNPTFFAHDLHIGGELVTEVTFPEELNVVKYATFARCTSITKVVLHENVKAIGFYAFVTCTGINEIDLGGVEIIDTAAFDGCYGISKLTLPETLLKIKNNAFRAAQKIIEIYNLSDIQLDKGFSSNGAVAKYAEKVYTEIPDISNFETDINGFVWYANEEKPYEIALVGYVGTATEVTVPYTHNDKMVVLKECAFAGNTVLQKVTFEDGFTAIPNRLFAYCFSLTEVVLPNTIISIGDHAFWSSGLKQIVLPANCTYIDQHAFTELVDCEITINATQFSYGKYAFGWNTNMKVNFAGTVEQWNEYVNVSNSVSDYKGILYETDFTAVCSNGTYQAYA